jgi:hypothetical protein
MGSEATLCSGFAAYRVRFAGESEFFSLDDWLGWDLWDMVFDRKPLPYLAEGR